jgi:hypothetical protein
METLILILCVSILAVLAYLRKVMAEKEALEATLYRINIWARGAHEIDLDARLIAEQIGRLSGHWPKEEPIQDQPRPAAISSGGVGATWVGVTIDEHKWPGPYTY